MDAVIEYVVDEYETRYSMTLSEEDVEKLRTRFQAMYTTTDLYRIYNWFLEEQHFPKLLLGSIYVFRLDDCLKDGNSIIASFFFVG